MFSSANPRADSARPLPSAQSRTVQECHTVSLHRQDQRKKCVIEYHDDRHRRHSNMCRCNSLYGSDPTHWGYTRVCKLTTHLWPSFKPDVREISKTRSHCWHRHSFLSDTALCCTKVVTQRWQKKNLIMQSRKLLMCRINSVLHTEVSYTNASNYVGVNTLRVINSYKSSCCIMHKKNNVLR